MQRIMESHNQMFLNLSTDEFSRNYVRSIWMYYERILSTLYIQNL